MISQQEIIIKASSWVLLLRWLMVLLLFASTVFVPFMIVTAGKTYPDLNIALIFCSGASFIWVTLLADYQRQTISVELTNHQFTVKKLMQAPKRYDYETIVGHNERLDYNRGQSQPFAVLTVYTSDDYFVFKSNEFRKFALLKDALIQYGKPVSRQQVLTLAERNRLRWSIGGLVLLIGATIGFGYLAHNSTSKEPAQLTAVTGILDRILENRSRTGLTGFIIRLHDWPTFQFKVSRRNFETDIRSLKQVTALHNPVTLLIRESDYRKKLTKTEPLTFGDKYSNYNDIPVFGVSQGNQVTIRTTRSVYEPTHTNPNQRAFLLSILLLFCWTGWVYVDRHKVLRPDK